MKRALAFAARNRKEILRDPLSYLFCLAFPIVMLVVICVGAFALTMAAKSAGRGECGGRCTGCGKCGKKIAGRK